MVWKGRTVFSERGHLAPRTSRKTPARARDKMSALRGVLPEQEVTGSTEPVVERPVAIRQNGRQMQTN